MELATRTTTGGMGIKRRELLLGIAVGAIVLAVVGLLGLRLSGVVQDGASKLAVGKPAPDFSLPSTGVGPIFLAQLRGKPAWINFWATWCPPCRTEMPDLQAVHESGGENRFNLVAMAVGEDAATVQKFLQQVGYILPVALDETGGVSLKYRVLELPTHVFIDSQGNLVEVYVGVMTREEMERRVAAFW